MFMQLFHTLFHSGGLPEDLYSTFLGKTRTTDHNLANSSLLAFLPSCNRHQSIIASGSIDHNPATPYHSTQVSSGYVMCKHQNFLATVHVVIQKPYFYQLWHRKCAGIAVKRSKEEERPSYASLRPTGLLLMCANITLSKKHHIRERRIHENTKHAKHLICHQIT